MTRFAIFALMLTAACAPKSESTDSTSLAAVDTLKPVPVADTLPTAPDTGAARTDSLGSRTKAPTGTKTSTKLGRDSATQPPNLPQLDTVPRRRPPLSR